MVHRLVPAVVVIALLLPSVAPAQDAAVDASLQMEAKRKRLIVRPEPPVAGAVRDADRASAEDAAARFSSEADATVHRAPQLDYDVTNAIQGRNIPHTGLRAPAPNR